MVLLFQQNKPFLYHVHWKPVIIELLDNDKCLENSEYSQGIPRQSNCFFSSQETWENSWFSDATASCWKIKNHHPWRAVGRCIPALLWKLLSKGKIPRDGWFFKLLKQSWHGEPLQVLQKSGIWQQPKIRWSAGNVCLLSEGEARRKQKKRRQNTLLADELFSLVGEFVPDTTKENKYFKLQQIKTDYSTSFYFQDGGYPCHL